ncbi:MAG TPA: MFS transporter [Chitinispirillaceae bacterium]|nr:MFS transporter [Chitinispirillaceae bacterium]
MKLITTVKKRFAALNRDMLLFISALAAAGFAESIFNAIFNNFLDASFSLNSFYRTFLEFPRESGGLLIVLVSALLFFIPTRRMAAISLLLGAVGLLLMAFFSVTFHWMFVWLFIFSLGQHLFMPINTSISMELAKEGETGKRLGQFNAIRNIAVIAGSFFVFLGFKFLHFNFKIAFSIAALSYLAAVCILYMMHPGSSQPPSSHIKLHKEYKLYYWLAILFGTRKQIFLTFAPWVLVTEYHQPTAVIATLLTVASISGIVFQPILGKTIDIYGEKVVLAAEAFLLIFVCFGYGFSKSLFSVQSAFIVACVCFIADQLLMSVNMARSTYLKKIAVKKEHITPTLTMAISLDHIFSISIALAGGVIWAKWGYQMVFLAGAGIAVVNLISAFFITIPGEAKDVVAVSGKV